MRLARASTFICLLLAGVPALGQQPAKEPSYGGRPLSYWIGRLDEGTFEESMRIAIRQPDDAFRAFRNIGPGATVALAEALKSDTFIVRYNSAEALEGMGPEARTAVPALTKALDDSHPQVRIKAVEALKAVGPEARAAIPRLTELLHDTKRHYVAPHGVWLMSSYARDALVGIGAEALPVFLAKARNDDVTVRFQAIEALGNFPQDAEVVLPVLVQALQDEEPGVRSAASAALGRLGPNAKSARAALARHLGDTGEYGIGVLYSGTVAYRAALALRDIGPSAKEIPALIRTMQDRDKEADNATSLESSMWYVRWLAAEMLGDLGEPAKPAVPALKAALDDEEIALAAAVALLQIAPGGDRPRQIIIKALTEDDSSIEFGKAVRAVRQFRFTDDATVAALHDKLKHEDAFVRIAAAGALLRIEPKSEAALETFTTVLQDAEDDLGWWLEIDKEEWPEVTATLKDVPAAAKAVLPGVMRALNREYDRAHALDALAAIGPHAREILPKLAEQLGSERDVDAREAAAMALGRLGKHAKPALPALVGALDEPRTIVRASAAEALGRIGADDPKAIAELTAALKDDYASVRRNAAEALGRLGPGAKSSIPVLNALRDDEYKTVRDAAARALAALQSGERN